MRLVVLTAAYPAPSEPERAVYIENLTRELVELAGGPWEPVAATVVAPRVSRSDPLREARRGIDVRRFRYPSGGRRLKEMASPSPFILATYLASGLAETLKAARQAAAELILCHWLLPAGPIGAAVSALLRLPFVLVVHGSDVHRYAGSSRLATWLSRQVLRQARLVLAVSGDLRRLLVESLRVPAAKVGLLPMGVDAGRFSPAKGPPGAEREAARRQLALDPSRPVLLFVGDLEPRKGVPELIEAMALLKARGLDVELCLVGRGSAGAELAASRTPSNHVRLVGPLAQGALAPWYRAADLLVLPSHAEGSPVTVMEAQACGLPVVASRVGGLPELVEDGRTGWLVAAGDAAGLASKLEELLRDGRALAGARERLLAAPPDVSAARRARELREILERARGK